MIELRYDERDCLDEVVGDKCSVHLERMDEHYFCLVIEDGERRVMLNVGSGPKYRRRVLATVYSDEQTATPQPSSASVQHEPDPPCGSEAWLFRELMAMMHGDGGHYHAQHGRQKAYEDAVAKYWRLVAATDRPPSASVCPHGSDGGCWECATTPPDQPGEAGK